MTRRTRTRKPSVGSVWKLLGLAGLVGVAATGAVVARAERRRNAYTPDEIRERLHARHAASGAAEDV